MGAFMESLNEVAERFYTLDEFPLLDNKVLAVGVISKLQSINEDESKALAPKLTVRELDAIILNLKDCTDDKVLDISINLLRRRYSPRLLKLMTRLFQYYSESEGLLRACFAMAEEAEKRKKYPLEGIFIYKFLNDEDICLGIGRATDEEGGDIEKSCRRYYIDPKSPVAHKCFLKYLTTRGKGEITANKEWMLRYLENGSLEDIIPLIKNYLSVFTIGEMSRRINLKILKRLGDPYESVEWGAFSKRDRDLIVQWNFLYSLKLHSADYPQKYHILSGYSGEIRSAKSFSEGKIFLIDFGEVVLADPKERPYSYFCKKVFFDEIMKENEGDSDSLLNYIDKKDVTVSARDFMIDKREEDCMKLVYEGVESLYINDMLDIKMGIEPDIRGLGFRRI